MERILNPLGWNLLFATTLALSAWLLGSIPTLRRRPTFLYALWLLVLAKLIVPPFIGLPLLAPLPVPTVERHFIPPPTIVAMPIEQPPAAIAVPAAPPSYHWTDYFYEPRFWLFTLTLASLLITAILWYKTFLQTRRWGKLLHTTLPTPVRLQNLARTAAASVRIQRIPEVRLVDAQLTPFLWTSPGKITRAKNISIVLPRELTEKLTDDQLLCILQHELAHYARRDHWAHAFAGFVTSLFWWNPVSWWAWRELRALQEICCDTLVLKYSPDSRRLYAETLYSVLESLQTRKSAQPALSCSFGDSRHLRRRFSMLADSRLQPRFSPFALLTLLALTPLLPCLPTRAEPPAPENPAPETQAITTETTDPAAAPATPLPKRYTIRMSIHVRSGKDGKSVTIAPSNSDTKLSATELALQIPALTIEAGQEATASTKLPEVMTSDSPYQKKSVVTPHLSITAKPSPTSDGKISLDLKYKVEAEGSTIENQPPESPFIIDPDLPKKVVLLGPQNDPNLLLEVTVSEADPQPLQYMINGTFHYQDPKSTDAQHPIESVKSVTRDGISATFGLNKLALPEFNLPGSFYGMALTPRSIDQQGKQIAFTSELTAFSLNPRTHKILEKYPEFFVESGKPAKLIFRANENGKPILWFDFTAETISLDEAENAQIAPPAYAPSPAPPRSIHPSRFGVVRTEKPADPNDSYQLHLTSFVKTPATPDHPSEILSETTPAPVLISNKEETTSPWPLQRTFLNGNYVDEVSQSSVTASVSSLPDFDNLVGIKIKFTRRSANVFAVRTINTALEIPLNHKLEFVLDRDKEGNPIHWLDIGVTEPYAPAPTTPATKSNSIFKYDTFTSQPTPQMHAQSHKLPERFWIRPGEHLSQMRSPTREDFQPILEHITKNFAPDSWSEKGGFAQYELLLLDHSLVVFSTPEVHNQIAAYLDTLRLEPPNQKGKYTLSLGLSLTGPGLFGVTAQSLNHTAIVAHNLITPTGKDPFGRPIHTREDYEKFIATLKEIEPKSWDTNGGPGKIEYSLLTGTIHFQNTSEVSSQIHNHCAELLQKNLAESPLKPGPLPPQPQPIQPVSNEVPDSNSNKPEPPPVPATPTSDNPQTKVDSQNPLYVVLYNVDKLFDLGKDRDLKQQPLAPADLQPLADQLVKSIAPNSWTSSGGQGLIKSIISAESGPCLVIRQTDEIHEQINIRIDKLRRERGIDTSRNFSHYPTNPASPDPNKMVTVSFALPDVVLDYTIDAYGRPIVDQVQLEKLLADLKKIDPQAWKTQGGPCSMTISKNRCGLAITATPEVFGKVNRHIRKLYHARRLEEEGGHYNGPINPSQVHAAADAYAVNPLLNHRRSDNKKSDTPTP